jgi:phosphoribosyl-ATP pyrophosphohydrolase/phosphoribosyl-AMP cyclohydrolase
VTTRTFDPAALAWDKMDGLLPAIVQDAESGALLMVGYMTREALEATLRTGEVTFFSRSKQRLWKKGETSGHTLALASVRADCDGDALLVRARPAGPVCHTGAATCFGDSPEDDDLVFLGRLWSTIDARFRERPNGTYTTRLFDAGIHRIAQKVGEEAVEVALAAKDDDREAFLGEAADLLYHLLVLLRAKDASLGDLARTLEARAAQPRRSEAPSRTK